MQQLSAENFQSAINQDDYSFVVFGSPDCSLCKPILEVIAEIEMNWPAVKFYSFDADANEANTVLAKTFNVAYMPRSIAFKGGSVCGQLLFSKPRLELEAHLSRLMVDGRLPSDPDDAEEVARFYDRVRLALGWEFKRDFPYEEWEAKAGELMDKAVDIMEKNAHWSYLSSTELQSICRKDQQVS